MSITIAAFVLIFACNFACNGLLNSPYTSNRVLVASKYHRRTLIIGRAVPSEQAGVAQDGDEETTLTLQGTISVSSNELRVTSLEEVSEFFRTQSHRDLLVTGGGERPCTAIEATSDQLKDWKNECLALGASEPDENDSILSVITRGLEFPGLKVESSSVIGVKYVDAPTSTSPKYEFVLLANEQAVSGLPPAVWIFKKLTGANDKGSTGENSKFKSLSTVTFEQTDNGKVVFRTEAFLRIGVTFPKILLKILPGDKKTIEERGGTSIVKTLDKDVKQSMEAFESAYLKKFNF